MHLRTANYPESQKWFTKTLASYERLGLLQKQSMVLLNQGITYYKTGDFEASLASLRRSHEIGVEGEWTHRQVFTNIALGNVYRFRREFEKARRHLHTGYSQAQSLGFPREEALALEFLGDVYRDEGHIRDAYRFYLRAQAIAKQIAPRGDIVMEVHRRMGECHLAEGDQSEALAELAAGLDLARAQADRYEEAVILRVMALASLEVADLGRAQRKAAESVEILAEIGARHELGVSRLVLVDTLVAEYEKGADVRRSAELLDRAWDTVRAALDLCLEIGIRYWVDRARQSVNRVSGLRTARAEQCSPSARTLRENYGRPRNVIIHTSTVMRDLLQLCDVYADTGEPVLITGETGTGKELVARRIHASSRRAGQEMVTVNVTAIPSELFEREFFGHVKGAYSGADRDGQGYAERADGSTLFLDEIGDLPLAVQPKLLRLLQDGTYQALGDPAPRRSDLRLIAATNADLAQLVQEGRFRADLYYRLKILELDLPPVRRRREDILLLLRHFLGEAVGRPVDLAHYFDQASQDRILGYRWPGNVREIAMVARRAAVELAAKKRVELQLVGERGQRLLLTGPRPKTLAAMAAEAGTAHESAPVASLVASRSVERSRILLALEESGGRKTLAAKRLGMSRSTLYRRMKRLEIFSAED